MLHYLHFTDLKLSMKKKRQLALAAADQLNKADASVTITELLT